MFLFESITVILVTFLLYKHLEQRGRIKFLEQNIRSVEIKSNLNEIELKQLYYFHDVGLLTRNPTLSHEKLSEIKKKYDDEHAMLEEKNKTLLSNIAIK